MADNDLATRRRASRLGERLFGGRNSNGLRTRGLFAARPTRRKRSPWRGVRRVLGGLLALAVILFAAVTLRLAAGPVAIDVLNGPLTSALAARIGHNYRFAIGYTLLEKGKFGPALTLHDVSIKDGRGKLVVAAPEARVEVNPFALLIGDIRPTLFELVDVDVHVSVLADGQLAISAASDAGTASAADPRAAAAVVTPVLTPPLSSTLAADAAPLAPLRDLARALAAGLDAATTTDSPLGALVSLGIDGGRLHVEDVKTGSSTTFKGFKLAFDRGAGGGTRLSIRAEGPHGPWSGDAKLSAGGGTRMLDLALKDLSLRDILAAAGISRAPIDTDMPLSIALRATLGADAGLEAAVGAFAFGAGHLRFDDPDDIPRLIDEITGKFHVDLDAGDIAVDQIGFFEQQTEFHLSGTLKPPHGARDGADDAWTLALNGAGVLGPIAATDPAVVIDRAEIALRKPSSAQRLDIERVSLHGPSIDATMHGTASNGSAGPAVKLSITNNAPTPIRAFFPLWPVAIANHLRDWCLGHMNGGLLQKGLLTVDLDAAGIEASRHDQPIPDNEMSFDLDFSGADVALIDGAPPMTVLSGHGHVTGRAAAFTNLRGDFSTAAGHALALSDMTFLVPDTAIKPSPASVAARLQGGADTLLELVSSAALKPYVDLPANLIALSGQVDSNLGVDFKVGPKVTDAPVIRASGQVKNFVVDKAIGSEKIEGDALFVTVDRDGVHAKGNATILGAAAVIDLRKAPGTPAKAMLTLTIDDAFRAKRGLSFGGALTGPVVAHVNALFGQPGPQKAQVDLDFTRLAIAKSIPGLVKTAGKPGKASFTLTQRPDGASIDTLIVDSGAMSVRGNMAFSANGDFSAKLSQLRISAADDMALDVIKSANVVKLAVRAKMLDARALLHELGSLSGGAGSAGPEIDVDMTAQAVRGFNDEELAGANLKLVRAGSKIRQLRLTSQVDDGKISASLGGPDGSTLTISSNNAGGIISFVDLYRHMQGGALSASLHLGPAQQDGWVVIRDFALHNEPALARIASAVPQSDLGDRASGRVLAQSGAEGSTMMFSRLQANFVHTASALALHDTVAWGSDVGATVAGTIDFGRDQLDLHGTFIPAYSVNNLFAKIPLFGPILGGDTHEGMFAINYRVSGRVSAPNLLVNPLSGITPGIFRDMFRAIDGTAPTTGDTQTTDPAGARTGNAHNGN